MNTEVKIPTVGESITSGVISIWHHKSGDIVKKGDPLLTLETDKVSTEISAEINGQLQILVEEGREVKIGEVVGNIAEGQAVQNPPAPATPPAPKPVPPPLPKAATPVPPPPRPAATTAPTTPIFSPAARRMAEEEGVKPSTVSATGPGGRITKEDVMAFLDSRRARSEASPSRPEVPQSAPVEEPKPIETALAPVAPVERTLATLSSAEPITTRKRLSPLRRKIAEHLVSAQQNAALLTTFNECDLTAVKGVRERMQESFQNRHGVKLGFMSFFIKAVVNALQEVPSINGRMDGEDFVQNHFYDIGVAVGTDRGLIVPVVRGADKKSFGEVERDLVEYAKRAREGKITLDDLQGGVFTISNGGVYGSLLSTPIVNPPQSGILGMHKIQDRPIAVDGKVEIRPMMYLALTYDHRVVDGKEAVTFLIKVKEGIEDPMSLLL